MPIGAAVGGAVIGGGASIIAGSKSASAQKQAAQTAADTSLATARENNALYRDIYNQNKGILSPYVNAGLPATSILSDMLYGGYSGYQPQAATPTPVPAPTTSGGGGGGGGGGSGALSGYAPASGSDRNAYLRMNTANRNNPLRGRFMAQSQSGDLVEPYGTTMPIVDTTQPLGATTASGTVNTSVPAGGGAGAGGGSAADAFAAFRNGTNYQWRLGEGQRALVSGWAARGALDSGAADRAKIEFNQNFASNELANYMDLLARQQAVGLSAASATAGVGNTYAGNVASSNLGASNAAANAALARGQATANTWGGIGQLGGQLGGALFQYGMGQFPGVSGPMYSQASSAPINVYNPNLPGF